MEHAPTVEKFQDARFDRRRLVMGNHGRCDDHVASVVVDDRYHGLAGRIACRKRIGATASLYRPDRDRPARSEWQNLAANEIEVAHAIEVGVLRNTSRAVAGAEFGAKIEADLGAAIGGLAGESAPRSPLIHREWPLHLGPGRMGGGCAARHLVRGAERGRLARAPLPSARWARLFLADAGMV